MHLARRRPLACLLQAPRRRLPARVSSQVSQNGSSPGTAADTAADAASDSTDGTAAGAGAQTSGERRAALDKRLDESLGEFDATLQQEQQRVASERDAQAATTVADNRESGDQSESSGALPTLAMGGRPGDLKSDRSGDQSESSGDGKTPPGKFFGRFRQQRCRVARYTRWQ